jgi:hypothetical protein
MGSIYKIEFPNEKHYIGLTTQSLTQRYYEHKCGAKNITNTKILYKALRKYDMVDTFELVEVDTAETVDELIEKEIEYIKIFNSYYKNKHGYNMTLGGEGVNGYVFTDEVKQQMSEIKKQYHIDNPDAGKQQGERTKQHYIDNPDARKQMSEIKKQYHIDNPDAGKQQGERTKQHYIDNPDARKQLSEIKKQYHIDNPEAGEEHRRKLKQYYTNPDAIEKHTERMKKRFVDNPELRKQMSETTKQSHIDNPELRVKISESVKQHYIDNPDARKQLSEKKKQFHKDNPEAIYKNLDAKGHNKQFHVFTTGGEFIKTFTYQLDAQKYLQSKYNLTKKIDISCVLRGKQKSSAGFIFKYKV